MGPYASLLVLFALTSVPSNTTSATTGGLSTIAATALSCHGPSRRRQEASSQPAANNRPSTANRLFKTRIGGFRLWASGVNWTPVKTKATEKFDVALDHVIDNVQAVVITQSGSAPLSSLADFALQSARNSDPNSTITVVENRVVNGHELVCITYESTLKAGPTTFYGYLYSEDQGTVEVIAMAPTDLFQAYRAEMTELLNGLEIVPPGTQVTEALPGPQAARPEDIVEINPVFVRPGKGPASNEWAASIISENAADRSGIGSVTSAPGSATTSGVATAPTSRPVSLNRPRPNYTEDARRGRVEGFIRVRALVGADGTVKDIRLITHLPDGLDEEAILAVNQMRFKPATKDDGPVAAWVNLEVEFNMCVNCVPAKPK